MGVYVKGMSMPENCLNCVLKFSCDYAFGEYGIGYNTFKPKECPLVEIPDDGAVTLCKKRDQDRCSEYCDGYRFDEECYEPT